MARPFKHVQDHGLLFGNDVAVGGVEVHQCGGDWEVCQVHPIHSREWMEKYGNRLGYPPTVQPRVSVSGKACIRTGYDLKCTVHDDACRPVQTQDVGCCNEIQRKERLINIEHVSRVCNSHFVPPLGELSLMSAAPLAQIAPQNLPRFKILAIFHSIKVFQQSRHFDEDVNQDILRRLWNLSPRNRLPLWSAQHSLLSLLYGSCCLRVSTS